MYKPRPVYKPLIVFEGANIRDFIHTILFHAIHCSIRVRASVQDISSEEIDRFSSGVINITGFQLIDRHDRSYWKFSKNVASYLNGTRNLNLKEIPQVQVGCFNTLIGLP